MADPRSPRRPSDHGQAGGASRGLRNEGNVCYLNAVLQALANTPAFVRALLMGDPKREEGDVRASLRALLVDMWPPKRAHEAGEATVQTAAALLRALTPHMVRRGMLGAARDAPFVQQDAHELYCLVADLLRCGEAIPPDPSGRVTWPLGDAVFGGELQQQLRCEACGAVSRRREPFTALTLDVPEEQAQGHPEAQPCNVARLLRAHFAAERLHGHACDVCHRPTGVGSAARVVRLWRLPEVLVLCVKRFAPDGASVLRHAVRPCATLGEGLVRCWVPRASPADDQLEQRRYARLMRDSGVRRGAGAKKERERERGDEDALYELRAVVCHVGRSQHGGHYVALARGDDGRTWHLHDDERTQAMAARRPPRDPGPASAEQDPMDATCPEQADATCYLLFYSAVV